MTLTKVQLYIFYFFEMYRHNQTFLSILIVLIINYIEFLKNGRSGIFLKLIVFYTYLCYNDF